MPSLLLLFEYPTLFGGERSALSILDVVKTAGFRVLAAAPAEGPLADALRQQAIKTLPFSVRDAAGQTRPLADRRQDLEQLLRSARPDLLHANSLAMSRLSGPVAKSLGLASVGHLRDIVKVSRSAIVDLNCHRQLIAVSRATRDCHVLAGVVAKKTTVVFNGVDLDEFRPRAATGFLHRELRLPPDAQLVGSIGQLSLRKGLDALIEAARIVVAQSDRAHFVIVGRRFSDKSESRQLEERLRSASTTGQLAGHVHWLGTRTDVAAILGELAVLAHAARQEPLGRVLLEAAAAGIAIVATDVGGTREIFSVESHAACLVAADDPDGLARELAALLQDDERRTVLGRAARQRAECEFDARQAGTNLVNVYNAVLK